MHQSLVRGRAPRHRGVLLGAVESVRPAAGGGRVGLRLAAPVKRGDGVVFDAGRPEEDECGERRGAGPVPDCGGRTVGRRR